MVFCPFIAAIAMQAATADTSDVVIENVRPSRITQQAQGGVLAAHLI